MSAPNVMQREASLIGYGILSVKATSALRSALDQQPLSTDDREALRRAAEFLEEIAAGTQIATTGTWRQGVRPSRSMAALDFAAAPMESVRGSIRGSVPLFFAQMATAVASGANNRLGPQRRVAALTALRFFEAFQRSLQR